ncbi:MAG: Maf family protein [Candidatus Gastranaerophilales bacterium]|nr:Maf family protein [Candidatus Gastranaerophilales bacterium]
MKKLILASASPRRRELMKEAGLEFEIIKSDFEENLEDDVFYYEKIEALALGKAKDVAAKTEKDALVIAADTVVVLHGKILTKPQDKSDAYNMIAALSGDIHQVVTAVAVIDVLSGKTVVESTTTNVEFKKIPPAKIEEYVNTDEPYDKAGAYAIQGLASVFVKNVDGCHKNVVGLSTDTLLKVLNDF